MGSENEYSSMLKPLVNHRLLSQRLRAITAAKQFATALENEFVLQLSFATDEHAAAVGLCALIRFRGPVSRLQSLVPTANIQSNPTPMSDDEIVVGRVQVWLDASTDVVLPRRLLTADAAMPASAADAKVTKTAQDAGFPEVLMPELVLPFIWHKPWEVQESVRAIADALREAGFYTRLPASSAADETAELKADAAAMERGE